MNICFVFHSTLLHLISVIDVFVFISFTGVITDIYFNFFLNCKFVLAILLQCLLNLKVRFKLSVEKNTKTCLEYVGSFLLKRN